jgi:hypothetical protein
MMASRLLETLGGIVAQRFLSLSMGQVFVFGVCINDQPANLWNGPVPTTNSPTMLLFPSTSQISQEQKAMTWRVNSNYTGSGHHYHLIGSDKVTNAYSGNTDVGTKQALLCIKKLNLPLLLGMPATRMMSGSALKGSWSGGRAAMLPQVRGSEIHSLEAANEQWWGRRQEAWKEDSFGMAEFHQVGLLGRGT